MLCFMDLDGVLVDFVRGALAFHEKEASLYENVPWDLSNFLGMAPGDFWAPLGETFWANLRPTEHCYEILAIVERFFASDHIFLLTSPCFTKGCSTGKTRWVEEYLPKYARRLLLSNCKEIFSQQSRILIDDSGDNCDKWRSVGGTAILVPRPWNSLKHLEHELPAYLQNQLEGLS